MGRPKREGVQQMISVRIDEDIYMDLGELCKCSGQTKTFVIQKALDEYLEKYFRSQHKIRYGR